MSDCCSYMVVSSAYKSTKDIVSCNDKGRSLMKSKNNRRFTFARIDISFAWIIFYESAEKLLSFARFNCAAF